MSVWSWLCKLYYDIGRQSTDFQLQIAFKDPSGEQGWSRRKSFLALSVLDEEAWVERVNNRTLLKNEIVIDYDKLIRPDKVLSDPEVLAARTWCLNKRHRYAIYHTGSRGVHMHIYIDALAHMTSKDRKEVRQRVIGRFCGAFALVPNFSGDYGKSSDNVPIALEHVGHWKTGLPKLLVDTNMEDMEDGGRYLPRLNRPSSTNSAP